MFLARIKDIARDFYFNTQKRGLKHASMWFFRSLARFVYHHVEYRVIIRSLKNSFPEFPSSLPFEIHRAEPEDLSRLESVVLPSELQRFRKRLSHGYGRICYMAFHEKDVISYVWATEKIDRKLDRVELHLEPGDVYIDDSFTVPDYRNRGVQTALQLQLLKSLRENGFKRAVAIVEMKNIPSQRVLIRKVGYKESHRLIFNRVLTRQIFCLKNGNF